MPLAPTARLGPYEIQSPLGAGGMGEVYRARDSRLGRDVAIKVLPMHLSANPEVRARFEREARTISSLNHPHICTLFDVGREGEVDFLVMELIEGETLAARLAKGALPPGEVLRLGAQIADALDRAHRAGVVHRDLKPGNVMLAKSGTKLMDFGLARATGLAGVDASGVTRAALTQSPTIAAPLTAEGNIVGTFQYMSPEQLEGKEVDERSDIWALGCVLYEMATGRRAFEGRSQASLISSIMSQEPPSISQVAPLAPPGLDRLIRNCLTKDPDERVRTAHDVKLQLQGLQADASSWSAAVAPGGRRPRGARLPWAIAAAATFAAVSLAGVLISRSLARHPAVQLDLEAPPEAPFTNLTAAVTISPDGRTLALVGADTTKTASVWLRRLDGSAAVRLAEGGGNSLAWSPDSRSTLVAAQGTLFSVPADGTSPTRICAVSGIRGCSWGRRGVIVFSPTPQSPLFRVAASGVGDPVQVTWLDSTRHEAGHRYPCFLPDGEHFLYVALPQGPNGFDVYAGALASRATRKILTADSAPVYAAPGYLIFRRHGKIMAQRFDAGALKLVGDPQPLLDAPPESDALAEPIASVSNNGTMVVLDSRVPDTQLQWSDRDGQKLGTVPLPHGAWNRAVLSPDDRSAIVDDGDDLWRFDLARANVVRLTSNAGKNSEPVWSPDGSRIAFTSDRSGIEEIYVMNSDGSGEARRLPTTPDLFKLASCWTSQGIVVSDIGKSTLYDLWLIAPEGNQAPRSLLSTRFNESLGEISPDGHWIAYLSNEAGTSQDVYVQSFPAMEHKIRVSSGGASRLWWTPTSDEICYRSAGWGEMMSVKLTRNGAGLDAGEPRLLFRFPPGAGKMDMTHDGRRVLVVVPAASAQRLFAHVILNWTSLLKR